MTTKVYIQSLYLRNFRNIEKAQLVFSPTSNLIQGNNAQGKTNLLEALYFLSTGRSFRTPHLADLIFSGASAFYLEATFIKDGTLQLLKIGCDGKKRKMVHNQTHYSTFTPLLGLLPTVLYAPQDISLINGGPNERRAFIDLHLAQRDPLYVHYATRYFRAMKHRNALIRKQNIQGIETWEKMMADAAVYIAKKRQEILQELAPTLKTHMHHLSQGEDLLEISYLSSFSTESPLSFAEQLAKGRKRDMHVGASMTGIHRDDFLILLNRKVAKLFSSEGQKRSALAALHLAQQKSLESHFGFSPLMSIDDFGIHLDKKRHALMRQQVDSAGQLFLTSPHELDTSPTAAVFTVERGEVRSANA